MRRLAFALAALATLPTAALPADGQSPLGGAEFEAYVTGKTLTFGWNGQAYGIEEYLSGRRVRWSFLDGECQEGVWYEQGSAICFLYEDRLDPQCWEFFLRGGRLSARFLTDEGETEPLYEVGTSDEPMICLGPEVGV